MPPIKGGEMEIYMFIGRTQELQFLEDRFQSSKGELIILYGRRRIGKTELLRQFCKGKEHIFFTCTEVPDGNQLQGFSKSMLSSGMEAAKYLTRFEDWENAFESIAELPFEQKKLVVIDEFPYMCRGNRSIPSVLQKLWDSRLKDENIMLILCGSSMSFIEKELLAEKNPLYGRATGIYKMKEMGFYDAVKFFPDYSDEDKMAAYSILGGIPYYLLQFDAKLSIKENIKKNILTKGCALYSETEFLLKQELRETAYYNMLIHSIASGSTTVSEISSKTGIPATKLNVYLHNLIELGIVIKEKSFPHKIRGAETNKKAIYKLGDNFFRFWYAFVFPNYGELDGGNIDSIYRYVIAPRMPKYISQSFEYVCQQFIRRLSANGKFAFPVSGIGRWWGKRNVLNPDTKKPESQVIEIDLLAEDFEKKMCLAGECKFTGEPVDGAVLEKLQEKYPKSAPSNPIYALFSRSGFKDSLKLKAEDILCFDLEAIVNGDI